MYAAYYFKSITYCNRKLMKNRLCDCQAKNTLCNLTKNIMVIKIKSTGATTFPTVRDKREVVN